MTDLIHNELLKLRATFLNGLAVAVFAVGGLAPIVSNFYGDVVVQHPERVIFLASVCIAAALALHYSAVLTLKGLRE